MSSLRDTINNYSYGGYGRYPGFNKSEAEKLINQYNSAFHFGYTDQELADAVAQVGEASRKKWGYTPPGGAIDPNSIGNWTYDTSPVGVALQTIANVQAAKGLDPMKTWWNIPEVAEQEKTSRAWSQDTYNKVEADIKAKADAEFAARTGGGMGFGSIFGDLLSNPVVLGLGGAALGLSGVLSGLGEAGAATGLGASAGESAALGSLGSGLTGVDLAGAGLAGTTPAMAGVLGSGLSGTTLASLGLDAGALGSAAAGAGGLSSLASTGGSMGDWTDFLGDWTNWGDAAGTASTAGDVTSQIAQLQSAVENGSMSLQDAMAKMQQVNNAASGGSWLDYLNAGAFPSEAAGAVADSSLPSWLKNASSAVKQIFAGNSGAGGSGGSSGFNLLGALLGGGLAAFGGGAKQSGDITTTQTPWGPQQPYLLDAWSKAKAAAEAGNPLQTQANSNYQSVLSGPTVNPMLGMDNPYLAKQIDYANQDVTRAMMPAMNQANKASGSFGNSGVADQYGKALTDAYSRNANDMRYKDYYAQQQLQKDAVGNTLGFTTGANAFNAAPSQEYAKTVQGNYGGNTTSPYFTNPTNTILGGAALGSQLGKLWG